MAPLGHNQLKQNNMSTEKWLWVVNAQWDNHMVSILPYIKSGFLVDIFCWGSGAPTIWIFKGPKQNLKGLSIEIHYQFSNFWGSIGPSGKISHGPHWILRGRGPYLPGFFITPAKWVAGLISRICPIVLESFDLHLRHSGGISFSTPWKIKSDVRKSRGFLFFITFYVESKLEWSFYDQ